SGKPASRVYWRLGGELLDDSDETRQRGVYSNTLHLPRLSRKHLHASLSCEASNSNHSAPVKTVITIEMNFKPLTVNFLGSREPLSAGKSYELECQSIGARPPAEISWWLEGNQLTNTSSRVSHELSAIRSKIQRT
ncbi:UNVERIFIED_CONTAM: hypothetical protein GTU68_000006, partial [Idotea baltica]|nr:hypothetical protein [Idotea baltica]